MSNQRLMLVQSMAEKIESLQQQLQQAQAELAQYKAGVEVDGEVYRNITDKCEELITAKLPEGAFHQGQAVRVLVMKEEV